MNQGLVKRFVAFLQIHILAHNSNGGFIFGMFQNLYHFGPPLHLRSGAFQVQTGNHFVIQAFSVKNQWNFIDGAGVCGRNHIFGAHTAKQTNFRFDFSVQFFLRATNQKIRLNSHLHEFFHRVLGGFTFQLPCRGNVRNISNVHKNRIFNSHVHPHLTNGFNKRKPFNVTDGSTNFHNGHF